MKKFATVSVLALALFALLAVTFDTSAEAHRRYRSRTIVGVGAAALVAGAVIAGSRAHAGPRYTCGGLARRCEDGSDWACRRFYERGC